MYVCMYLCMCIYIYRGAPTKKNVESRAFVSAPLPAFADSALRVSRAPLAAMPLAAAASLVNYILTTIQTAVFCSHLFILLSVTER